MIKISCDIGERGVTNEIDIELMQYIDIANIACGGHAGNEETVKTFRKLADDNNITVSAHLSYPDPENFGRDSIDISTADLLDSLSEQYSLLPEIRTIKLHGALYNDCWKNTSLADAVAKWSVSKAIQTVIAPDPSALKESCLKAGLSILAEAFGERRYKLDSNSGTLSLVSRSCDNASIHNVEEALRQFHDINNGEVRALVDNTQDTQLTSISADTICIHSDSPIALQLIKRLKGV